jgi:hypothetical protein
MQPDEAKRWTIRGIMIAIFLWGTVLAIGAGLFGVDAQGGVSLAPNVVRGLIVWFCVLAFLGFWIAALRRNKR